MNPYEADPDKIPVGDRYADVPFYGRYHPKPGDFRPEPEHISSTSRESLAYWKSVVVQLCDASVRVYENDEGGRDVFALGSVIVKSSHLHAELQGRRSARDLSYNDANEVEAIKVAREALAGVRVPEIYFAGKIDGRDVLVQERIPGGGLNVAWQYISKEQKESFKKQARQVLRQLQKVAPSPGVKTRSYVAPDPDPVRHKGIQELEHDIIFSCENTDPDLCFMHNDFTLSNCIVNNDKIVALVDWEMAGFIGWKTAGEVHDAIRTPMRESFAGLDLPEEQLQDILFWKDLYEVSERHCNQSCRNCAPEQQQQGRKER